MDDYSFESVFTSAGVNPGDGEYVLLEINRVHPNPNQPRKQFDQETLEELAESIRVQGIIQPLIVEKISDDEYAIITGERRYRAALIVGLEKIPVIIKKFSDLQRLEISLIENIQRENLNPIEEARAYVYLLEQSHIRQEELANRVGKKRSTITNSIRLLQLPREMQDSLLASEFSAGHARALLSVINPSDQEYLYQKIIAEGMTVRKAESYASDLNAGKRMMKHPKDSKPQPKSVDILAIEQRFIEACKTKVELKGTLQKGKVEISYHSMQELERIYALFGNNEETIEL
ncbi:MAG: ParB/RepB/Spo0J family partition protein [Spirochaetia bacterium]|nr:ParB/RepB/Spo0J family partition protein [Spirochaetia bacterium]